MPAAADLLAALPTPVTEGDDAPAAQAADTTVGSLTISGGTAGVDYTVSGTTVVVQTGTPLTFKGTPSPTAPSRSSRAPLPTSP